MSNLIAATDLVVRYGDRTILDRATLGIQEGDRIGLVGRNGCGKTTFLKILAGLQTPDSGEVSRRRDLVVSYLPQDFMLDTTKNVFDNIRDGAQHVWKLIAELSPCRTTPNGTRKSSTASRPWMAGMWTAASEVAMAHLNCPPAERSIGSLSGGEKRRVAMCRAIVSQPDFLMLDEPTNHLDPESIEWVAEFLENFGRHFPGHHPRPLLSGPGGVEHPGAIRRASFIRMRGNYTDYLLAKAERQEADATIEHKRQMFLKKELAWVRQGPRAQRSKQKDRFERYYETARPGRADDRGGRGTGPPAAAPAWQPHGGGQQPRHRAGRADAVRRV